MKFLIGLLNIIRLVGAGMFFMGIGWSVRSFFDPDYDLGGAIVGGLFGLALAFAMNYLIKKLSPEVPQCSKE
jgi:hypothetical protein